MGEVVVDTEDLGEAEVVISALFAKLSMSAASRDAPTRTRFVRSTASQYLTIDEAEFTYDMSYEMVPSEQLLLCRFYRGGIHSQPDRHPARWSGPGEIAAYGALDGIPLRGLLQRAHYHQVTISRSLLDRVAAGPSRRALERVTLTAEVPTSEAANRQMVDAVDYVVRTVARNPNVTSQSLVVGTMGQYLAASLLATFPSTAVIEPTIEDRHDSTQLLLRRAMNFIDDNAHTDLSLVDIAQAVYVTPRALQHMFRRHRDCTPLEYLRKVRLHHAHLALLAGSPTHTTVGAIANQWGFANRGRFAAYYRSQYGETPQATLRR